MTDLIAFEEQKALDARLRAQLLRQQSRALTRPQRALLFALANVEDAFAQRTEERLARLKGKIADEK